MSSPPGFTFTAGGSGTNLIRSTVVAGRTLRINTGHGYYQPHSNSAGAVTDLRASGLTPDQIETAIALDVQACLSAGVAFPLRGPGFLGPLLRSVTVGGIMLAYRVVELAGGTLHVGTSYQV
jgi:hypothetical protein